MSADHRFTSAHSALETFKRGSRGPRWEAAGEYLMRNANADTRMLLDFAIERTRQEVTGEPMRAKRKIHPGWLVAAAVGGAALVAVFVWLLFTILGDIQCS